MAREVPKEFLDLLPVWNTVATRLQRTYVALGILGTLSSLAVGIFSAELGDLGVKIVSYILAASLGLITAFDLGHKANSARGAWRLLNAAVIAYKTDETFSSKDLWNQYVAGEAMLGDIKYNAPEKPKAPENHKGSEKNNDKPQNG